VFSALERAFGFQAEKAGCRGQDGDETKKDSDHTGVFRGLGGMPMRSRLPERTAFADVFIGLGTPYIRAPFRTLQAIGDKKNLPSPPIPSTVRPPSGTTD